jgi:hypothetical protein
VTEELVRLPSDVSDLFMAAKGAFIWAEEHGAHWDWPGLPRFRESLELIIESATTNDPAREAEFVDAARKELGAVATAASYDLAAREYLKALDRANSPFRRPLVGREDSDRALAALRGAKSALRGGAEARDAGAYSEAATRFRAAFEESREALSVLESVQPQLETVIRMVRLLIVPAGVAILLAGLDRLFHAVVR